MGSVFSKKKKTPIVVTNQPAPTQGQPSPPSTDQEVVNIEDEYEDKPVDSEPEEEPQEDESEKEEEEKEDEENQEVEEKEQEATEEEKVEESEDEMENISDVTQGDVLKKILSGHINISVPSQVKIVRIFTSSTFTDTFNERNALMVRVYPRLKKYCQAKGFDFQVVDMRWGVRDEATADHMTSELCMREIKACQQLSTGPNFISFLSQKYGYRPFPVRIPAKEFDALLESTGEESDRALLKCWFMCDSNHNPPTRLLQPITDVLPDYNNYEASDEARKKASSDWWTDFERMQVVLRKAATEVEKKDGEYNSWKYFMSVTEDEIERGMLNVEAPEKSCFWFYRTIDDLAGKIDDKVARNFIDKLGPVKDDEAFNFLEKLKNEKMSKILPETSVKKYQLKWQDEVGIDPPNNQQHKEYIDQLCTDFEQQLIAMIDAGIAQRQNLDIDDATVKEVCQHVSICQEKSSIFKGRDDILAKIAEYVDSEYTVAPLVVSGESGCGKTAIMAKAATMAKRSDRERLQVLRFLGTTAESTTLVKTLYSICCQLVQAQGESVADVPTMSKPLKEFFAKQIEDLGEKEEKVVFFIDSVDQLKPDDGAYLMKWLPKVLPNTVKIILSSLHDQSYGIVQNLKNTLEEESFIEVEKLADDTVTDILNAWLDDASKTLTPDQTKLVMEVYARCPTPLFLRLCFDEACRWKSYTPPEHTLFERGVKDQINTLFARIERYHGKVLVSHALGLISASKDGLSDAELDDLLSIDDEVLNDVYQYWTPPARRIPPLLWLRIKSDLGGYITRRGANGVLVNQWYHRQFREAAEQRYLAADDDRKKYHALLAEYFRGCWSKGVEKPYTDKAGTEGKADRLVAAQPNAYSQEGSAQEVYNFRKLSELPTHLLNIADEKVFCEEVAFNFDFLYAKLQALGYRSVLEDAELGYAAFPENKELKLMFDFFKFSGRTLMFDTTQLPTQIVARMKDNDRSQSIARLVTESQQAVLPCMYPNQQCFEAPSSLVVHNLTGHEQGITHVNYSVDGKQLYSLSQDSTLRIWDTVTGKETRCIELEQDANMVFPSCVPDCIIIVNYSEIISQDLKSEETYYKEYHSVGSMGQTADISKDLKNLVAMGSTDIFSFDASKKILKLRYGVAEAVDNTDGHMTDVITAGKENYVYTRGNNTQFHVRKYTDESYKYTVDGLVGIIFLIFTPDEDKLLMLYSPSPMTETYKKVEVKIYNLSDWSVLRTLEGQDPTHLITTVYSAHLYPSTSGGLELVWPVFNRVNFWNIDTGVERLALQSGYRGNTFKQAISFDGRHMPIVSMDQSNTSVKIYDMSEIEYTVVDGALLNKSDVEKVNDFVGSGEREMFAHEVDPSMMISVPPVEQVLNIWNTDTYTLVKRVKVEGLFAMSVLPLDDDHVIMWETNKKKLLTLNVNKGEFVCATSEGFSKTASSYNNKGWVYVKQKDRLLVIDETQKNLRLFDWRTGVQEKFIEVGRESEATRLIVWGNEAKVALISGDSDIRLDVVSLETMEKLGVIERSEGAFDTRPEVCGVTRDDKYFLCFDYDHQGISVFDLTTFKKAHSIKYFGNCTLQHSIKYFELTEDENERGYPNAMIVASEYALVYFTVNVARNQTYVQEHRIAKFTVGTWERSGDCMARGMVNKFEVSRDSTRAIAYTHNVGAQLKQITLYDAQHDFRELANLVPETDTRSVCLRDSTVCVLLPDVQGVTFFRACASEPVPESGSSSVVEVVADYKKFAGEEEEQQPVAS